jgi:branched-chain amino acid transport system substrate-binding protein
MAQLSRRGLLLAGGAAFSAALYGRAGAAERGTLRIGTVVPSKTGELIIHASVNDHLGEGARMGLVLAEAIVAEAARHQGLDVEILLANAPSASAAVRAGQRLIQAEGVDALIGGIGEGQAAALGQVAEDARVPFFNIGSTDDRLRNLECGRFSFHIEASDAMYLDAMAEMSVRQSLPRWFVVHENTERGNALMALAHRVTEAHEAAAIVGTATVFPEQPYYGQEIEAAQTSDADVIVLLLDAADQIVFLSQQENFHEKLPALTFPEPLTQTRDYIAAARFRAPATNPRHRLALWETTASGGTAGDFNDTFRSRWGEPANPTAWAAYQAVKIIAETVLAVGGKDGETIVEYLERPEAEFDAGKGSPVSFRPEDHQLRQSLYVIRVDQDGPWSQLSLSSRIGIAEMADEIAYRGDMGAGLPEPAECQILPRETRLRGSDPLLQRLVVRRPRFSAMA